MNDGEACISQSSSDNRGPRLILPVIERITLAPPQLIASMQLLQQLQMVSLCSITERN
jgi:hypothetical protein